MVLFRGAGPLYRGSLTSGQCAHSLAILEQDGLIQRGWSFIKSIPYKWSMCTQPGHIRTRWSYSEGLVLYKEDPLQVVSVHTAWPY